MESRFDRHLHVDVAISRSVAIKGSFIQHFPTAAGERKLGLRRTRFAGVDGSSRELEVGIARLAIVIVLHLAIPFESPKKKGGGKGRSLKSVYV